MRRAEHARRYAESIAKGTAEACAVIETVAQRHFRQSRGVGSIAQHIATRMLQANLPDEACRCRAVLAEDFVQ